MKAIWIIEAKYLNEFRIYLKFSDGVEGTVDLFKILKGPVFEPLKEKEYFKNFSLNTWTLEWPNGADLAPEFLYDQVLKNHTVS